MEVIFLVNINGLIIKLKWVAFRLKYLLFHTQDSSDLANLTKPQVFFVLGGPGSGKGTQCENLVRDFKFKHLSVGELLREEKQRGGPDAKMIDDLIKQGKLVSSELVVKLIRKNLGRHGNRRYLIDGFPRNMENYETFKRMLKDQVVVKKLIFFECSTEVMTARIMQRGKSSGRTDDNPDTIKLRMETYQKETLPVVKRFQDAGNCITVNAEASKEVIYQKLKSSLDQAGIFPPDPAEVIFVLGGPGSGKGTQCDVLVKQFGFRHLSTGDLLRDAVKNGSQKGKQIEACMKEGKLVSSELLVRLVEQKMERYNFGGRYLLDGFPRGLENIEVWEKILSKWTELKGVLYFKCEETELVKRLVERGKTSGRTDDNEETIKKRLEVFNSQTAPVIAAYHKEGKVMQIDAMRSIEEVSNSVRGQLANIGIKQKYPNSNRPKIVLVLGGPGSGKGTQCDRLKQDFGFKHLSTGDLLREQQKNEGLNCDLIGQYIKEGRLVPSEILVTLIRKAIENNGDCKQFLLDGFPRNQQNIDKWNEIVGIELEFNHMVYIDCSEKVMEERLMNRGKTSGRADDNPETIRKRFNVFVQETKPIIAKMQKQPNFVIQVNAERAPDEIYKEIKDKLVSLGYQTV